MAKADRNPWLLYLDVAHLMAELNGMKCNLIPLDSSNYISRLIYHIYIRQIVLVLFCFLKARLRGRIKFKKSGEKQCAEGKHELGRYKTGNYDHFGLSIPYALNVIESLSIEHCHQCRCSKLYNPRQWISI